MSNAHPFNLRFQASGRNISRGDMRRQSGHGGRPRPAMQGAAFSLRLVVIVGFGVEIALIADLDLGDERERDRDRDRDL
ncbi:hypothetical protein CN135_32230 [Sinorhizobium meliloti]|nr:hypothetical protein CN135_32230 [Sinorhizobium meliloti]